MQYVENMQYPKIGLWMPETKNEDYFFMQQCTERPFRCLEGVRLCIALSRFFLHRLLLCHNSLQRFNCFDWQQKYTAKLVVLAVSGGWVGLKACSVIGRECKLYDLVHCAAQLSVIVKLDLLIGGDRDTSHRWMQSSFSSSN